MRTSSQADLAVRLRLAIARTARRLRQEAEGELSPSQGAALATIDRHGPLTPSELAARERIQRPTATRVPPPPQEPGLGAPAAAGGVGAGRPSRGPGRPPLLAREPLPRGRRPARRGADAQGRVPLA